MLGCPRCGNGEDKLSILKVRPRLLQQNLETGEKEVGNVSVGRVIYL